MQKLIITGRIFYGASLAAFGIWQFFLPALCTLMFPPWPSHLPGYRFISFVVGALLIVAGVAITINKNTAKVSMLTGYFFLALLCFYYIPYELLIDPYNKYLGSWTNALKELAMAGGAFCIAAIFIKRPYNSLQKIIFYGKIFFAIMLLCFGVAHFLYRDIISTLVPSYIPWHIFWTYFAGVALIAAGISFIVQIQIKLAGIILGNTIFIWLIILHLPLAIVDPMSANGNQVTSAISALAFSGIAFVIAGNVGLRK